MANGAATACPVAPEGLHRDVGRLPGGVRRQELRHVRLGPAPLTPVEEGRGLLHHEVGGLDVRVGAGYGELDALVLSDGTAEDDALVGPPRRPAQKEAAVAHALGGDEDALGVHAVHDVPQALALLPDKITGGHLDAVEQELVRKVVHHHAPAPHLQAVAGVPQVHYKDREAFGAPLHLLDGRRPGEQDHEVGVLDAGDVDLAPVYNVAVAAPLGEGRDARRVGTGLGLGDAEGLQPELARRYLRQVLLLLLCGAVAEQRPHDVHLGVGWVGVGA